MRVLRCRRFVLFFFRCGPRGRTLLVRDAVHDAQMWRRRRVWRRVWGRQQLHGVRGESGCADDPCSASAEIGALR